MKKTLISLAAAGLLAGSSAIALAQSSNPNSANQYAPGQQDRQSGDRGASGSAPGQLQTSPGGAKDLAPGQQKMNTDGSASADTKNKTSTTGSKAGSDSMKK